VKQQARVSLIATVRNERDSIASWLDGVGQQSRLPDELIVVDGGSTDGTWELLEAWSYPCTVVLRQAHGATISAGRNLAFSLATGSIIAITDAGTIADREWLSRLVGVFSDPDLDVASGFFVPHSRSIWERSLAAATLPDVREIRPSSFLPSSRSVALRTEWVRHGFVYPEWLDYCEDLIWDLQLQRAGARFEFVPEAVVRFEVRPGPRAFAKQYFRYARGDGKAGLFGKRHLIRYATYLTAMIAMYRKNPVEIVVVGLFGAVYLARPVRRLVQRGRADKVGFESIVTSLGLLPFQVVLGDVAKMAGFPVGVRWRWRTFKTLYPSRNWRMITPSGEMWDQAKLREVSLPRED
jgi:cellulose synthase/poly-beta-1,6-N-acetylglucosamine synthase-like glycosyltransferase